MENSEFKIIKRFGPSVLKVKIPEKIINTLNKHFDKAILDKKESQRLNHGEDLVGDVTQELKLEKEIMEKSGWTNFLGTNIDRWMKEEVGKGITKFVMLNSWIVRQFKNEYNPTHWHNGHLSGAGYLKVPKNLGKHYQNKESVSLAPIFYSFTKKLKEMSSDNIIFIHHHENMILEKALILGVRKYLPKSKLIGYFHTTKPRNQL